MALNSLDAIVQAAKTQTSGVMAVAAAHDTAGVNAQLRNHNKKCAIGQISCTHTKLVIAHRPDGKCFRLHKQLNQLLFSGFIEERKALCEPELRMGRSAENHRQSSIFTLIFCNRRCKLFKLTVTIAHIVA